MSYCTYVMNKDQDLWTHGHYPCGWYNILPDDVSSLTQEAYYVRVTNILIASDTWRYIYACLCHGDFWPSHYTAKRCCHLKLIYPHMAHFCQFSCSGVHVHTIEYSLWTPLISLGGGDGNCCCMHVKQNSWLASKYHNCIGVIPGKKYILCV